MISHSRLHEVLSYDPITGLFTWLNPSGRRVKPGTIAGHLSGNGYYYIQVDGKRYLRGRLAWFYTYGQWPKIMVDHKDGDTINDKIDNLREASSVKNARNQKRRSDNTSGKSGVAWRQDRQQWIAYIRLNGKHRQLGSFSSFEEAVLVRVSAEKEYFGEFRSER